MCRAIAQSALQPRLVDVLDPAAAQMIDPAHARLPAGQWSVVVGAAGDERVVQRHGIDLARITKGARATAFVALTDEEEATLLGRIREVPMLAAGTSLAATLFKISVVLAQMLALLERARQVIQRNQLASMTLLRASGIVYLALVPTALDAATLARLTQAATELIHASSSSEIGGRPVIQWGPTELKSQGHVWGPRRRAGASGRCCWSIRESWSWAIRSSGTSIGAWTAARARRRAPRASNTASWWKPRGRRSNRTIAGPSSRVWRAASSFAISCRIRSASLQQQGWCGSTSARGCRACRDVRGRYGYCVWSNASGCCR